jgi:sigma-54 dependent transcriptional regulator, acetoin dehydrogenase operon transcriptional activator AcoR
MESISHQGRLAAIAARRQAVLHDGLAPASGSWLEKSWLRCMELGHKPNDSAIFQTTSRHESKRLQEQHHQLLSAALPVMVHLAESIAKTGYFAILTDESGVVLNAQGNIDKSDIRATQITIPGIDLSERAIGTTAIGCALSERANVWLHRDEHFLASNRVFSCAGAPVFGLNNECVGMLDLTGIEVAERRELMFLAARSTRNIQNSLIRQRYGNQSGVRLLQIQWLGSQFDNHSDGLVALDADGNVLASNRAALDWLPDLEHQPRQNCEALFSMSTASFFSALKNKPNGTIFSLWSGIQVHARWCELIDGLESEPALKTVEAELIRRAMLNARGNVESAAAALGISRATLYRKLHRPVRH